MPEGTIKELYPEDIQHQKCVNNEQDLLNFKNRVINIVSKDTLVTILDGEIPRAVGRA